MAEILGPDWFPRNDEEYRQLWENHIAGTKHTNWGLLANASRSSLVAAVVQCSDLIGRCHRQLERGQHPAETNFLLELNYQSLAIGPLLGAVITSAMAIEAFVSLIHELALELKGLGGEELESELKKVINLPFTHRIMAAIAAAGAPRPDNNLATTWEALVEFRSDCTHGSPLEFHSGGRITYRKRGKTREADFETRYRGLYPDLSEGPMPLTPRHAIRAARAHDELTKHITSSAAPGLKDKLARISTRAHFTILGSMAAERSDVDRVADDWENVLLKWRQSVTMEQQEDFYRNAVRKLVVRSID